MTEPEKLHDEEKKMQIYVGTRGYGRTWIQEEIKRVLESEQESEKLTEEFMYKPEDVVKMELESRGITPEQVEELYKSLVEASEALRVCLLDAWERMKPIFTALTVVVKEMFLDELKDMALLEENVYSEKEIRKRIKYAKTPMEAKHWNKILNERLKGKKGSKKNG